MTSSITPSAAVRPRLALAVLLIGMFMALLDTSIVNVSLADLQSDLGASGADLTWIVSGYLLAFGLALIPAGRLGDRIGHKRVFGAGIALFTLASLACGLAQDPGQLVAARIVQGFAGGVYLPAVTAFIQLLFTGPARGRAFAVMGSVIGVATALGPLVGGGAIALAPEEGWRLVFLVNIPLGALALGGASVFLPLRAQAPAARPAGRGGFDVLGLVLLVGGLAAVLVPLIGGQDAGWPTWTTASFVAGAVLVAAFVAWEGRVARRGRTPLVPLRLFGTRAFSGGAVLAFTYFAALMSVFFAFTLLWQNGLGHSALEAGLAGTPFAIGSIVGAAVSGRVIDVFGRPALTVGIALVVAGLIATVAVLALVPAGALDAWMLLVPFFAIGAGSGLSVGPNARFIVSTVRPDDAGAASGVLNTMQRIGSSVGIAVIGLVLFAVVGPIDAGAGASTGAGLATGTAPGADAERWAAGAAAAIAVSAAFAVIALLVSFVLPRRIGSGPGSPAPAPTTAGPVRSTASPAPTAAASDATTDAVPADGAALPAPSAGRVPGLD